MARVVEYICSREESPEKHIGPVVELVLAHLIIHVCKICTCNLCTCNIYTYNLSACTLSTFNLPINEYEL